MPPPISLDSTFGALSIGFSLSCVVFGVLTAQTYVYFREYYSWDRPAYMILVTIIWILECADQAIIGHSVYYYTITNYGNYMALVDGGVIWSLSVMVVLSVFVGSVVKVCFAIRVWRFSGHNYLITGIIFLFILTQFGAALALTIQSFRLSGLIEFSKLNKLATLSLASGVATDVTIAISLCFFLRKIRRYTSSSSLAHTLIIYAVSTGALTGAVNACTLILYNTHTDAFYFIALYFILGKLYAISFISALDTRLIIRGKDPHGTSMTANVGNSYFAYSAQTGPSTGGSSQHRPQTAETGPMQILPARPVNTQHDEADKNSQPPASL